MFNPNQSHDDELNHLIKEFLQKTQPQPVEIQLKVEDKQKILALLQNIQDKQLEIRHAQQDLLSAFDNGILAHQQQISNLKNNSINFLNNYKMANQDFIQNKKVLDGYLQRFEELQETLSHDNTYLSTHKSYIYIGIALLLILSCILSGLSLWQKSDKTTTTPIYTENKDKPEPKPNTRIPSIDYDFAIDDATKKMLQEITIDDIKKNMGDKKTQLLFSSDNFTKFGESFCQTTQNHVDEIICKNKDGETKKIIQYLFLLDYAEKFKQQSQS